MIERRAGLNFRVQGRTVSGTALRYGDVANMGRFREMFVSGAFAPIGSVALNLQHDSQRVLARTGNGLVLADGPRSLEVRADLKGSAEHELVKRGALRGFSIEFRAKDQRYEGGTRIIESAELTGLALVDEPAYPESLAEARARSGRTMRATIPAGKRLECRCSGVQCKFAEIVGEAMQDMFDEVFVEAKRQIIAGFGSYDVPLASTATGTIRGRILADGDGEVEVDLPVGPEGDLVLRAHENSGVIVRPHLDALASEGVEETGAGGENTMRYTTASMRALLISSTDARAGWPAPTIVPTPGMDEGRAGPAPRREVRWWLL